MTEKEMMANVAETESSSADTPTPSSDPQETKSQSIPPKDKPVDASSDPADDNTVTAATLEEKLVAAEQQVQESHERFLRAAAELDNFRKRKEREISDLRKYANQALLRELLGVVDNLERALVSARESGHPEALMEGVEMTLKELLKIFNQFGVTPIEALEQPFDPNHHEAVMQQPSDAFPANTVIQELQKGYLLRDRLLRPAMVVVSTESA
jgi:molecular chaperone GrpE